MPLPLISTPSYNFCATLIVLATAKLSALPASCCIDEVVNGKGAFSLLPAGEGSDAASELLDSRKLLPVLRELKSSYDYILLDLEAIGSSVDAASVGKELDGIVVALRDDCCKRNQLDRCVSQLEYASAKILGFAVLEKKSLQKRK